MYTYEFIVENVENKKARLFIFEVDVSGIRSVRNICEESIEKAASFFGDEIEILESEDVKMHNENIDFGRAKRWSAKMRKIIETLVKENREH